MSWLFKNWYYLYANPTEAEQAIEPAIAALGVAYRAQHLFPGLKHIADFALLDDKIIIEVDGASHKEEGQVRKDLTHTLALNRLGWRVVRCTNEEATSDPHATVARLLDDGLRHLPTRAELEARLLALGPAPVRPASKRRGRKRAPAPKTGGRKARKAAAPLVA